MRRLTTVFAFAPLLLAGFSNRAAAQQKITVQEPSLETFGVGTTVSVPDRGRVSLGGVGRAAMSRSMSRGPFRHGTSIGLSTQGTGLSVGVHVQDLAELDRAALDAAGKARRSRDQVRLPPGAEHAYETLRARRLEPDVSDAAQDSIAAAARNHRLQEPPVDAGPSPDKLLDRARQAEAAGKRELALAWLRAARDRGSDKARREIERLTPTTARN